MPRPAPPSACLRCGHPWIAHEAAHGQACEGYLLTASPKVSYVPCPCEGYVKPGPGQEPPQLLNGTVQIG